MAKNESHIRCFDSESDVPVEMSVRIKPKSGEKYIFKWGSDERDQEGNIKPIENKDWRADGYRFHQNAKKPFMYGEIVCYHYYFKLQIGPKEFTDGFRKHAIICPIFVNRILIWYEGDNSAVTEFCHGNVKNARKKNFPHSRTAPSLLEKMKIKKDESPIQIYSDLMTEAPKQLYRQQVEAPRNLGQVQNAVKNARAASRLSKDQLYNLIEVANETNFVSDFHIHPDLIVICYRQGNDKNISLTVRFTLL